MQRLTAIVALNFRLKEEKSGILSNCLSKGIPLLFLIKIIMIYSYRNYTALSVSCTSIMFFLTMTQGFRKNNLEKFRDISCTISFQSYLSADRYCDTIHQPLVFFMRWTLCSLITWIFMSSDGCNDPFSVSWDFYMCAWRKCWLYSHCLLFKGQGCG
jgi:hypothetical protein